MNASNCTSANIETTKGMTRPAILWTGAPSVALVGTGRDFYGFSSARFARIALARAAILSASAVRPVFRNKAA